MVVSIDWQFWATIASVVGGLVALIGFVLPASVGLALMTPQGRKLVEDIATQRANQYVSHMKALQIANETKDDEIGRLTRERDSALRRASLAHRVITEQRVELARLETVDAQAASLAAEVARLREHIRQQNLLRGHGFVLGEPMSEEPDGEGRE